MLIFSLMLVAFAIFMLVQNLFNVPPYMPSFNRRIKVELEEFLARWHKDPKHKNLKPKFIDLGAGDGKITFMAAKLGFEAYGIEINPFLIALDRIRALFAKRQNRPNFIFGSYFNHDLKEAEYDVIFTYLFPSTMQELEEKIFTEAKKGTVIISNTFKFKEHTPKSTRNKVLVYEV